MRAVLWHWAGGSLPLPQARTPSTVGQLVIVFGPESYYQGSVSFMLRGGGGSRRWAVAWLGVHTSSKNLHSVSKYKHTLFISLMGESSRGRLFSAQKTIGV